MRALASASVFDDDSFESGFTVEAVKNYWSPIKLAHPGENANLPRERILPRAMPSGR